jgi:transcriptional regulator with XRE-family HTH domain
MLDFDVGQIERYMEIKDWSQAELARKMGISESYLSRILRGERMPGRKFIGSLLQTCKGLEFDDVFFFAPAALNKIDTVGKEGVPGQRCNEGDGDYEKEEANAS